MEEWKEYRLEEIGEIVGGSTPSTKDPKNYDGDISWITPKDLSNFNGRYISKGERMISSNGLKNSSCKMLPKGSILFSSRAPIGYIAIASNNLCTNQGFKSIVPDCKIVDNIFLYYLLVFNKNKIESLGSGTTFKEVSGKTMKNVCVKIPSLTEQKEIANILSSIDDKIENNRRINENLEQQAQALFKSWFVDFEPFRDQPFVESELGMIPQGWKVGKLGDICVTNKRTYGANFQSQILYLDTGSVTNNNIEELKLLDPKIDKIPSRARRVITEGDIVYSSVRPNQRHFAFMYDPQSNLVASTGFIVITANWSCYRYYIYQYLTQEVIINSLHAIAEQSVSTYPSINATDITNLNVVLPPDDVIIKFAEICNSYFSIIYNNQNESSDLAKLRDTLLPKLMSGEIKV